MAMLCPVQYMLVSYVHTHNAWFFVHLLQLRHVVHCQHLRDRTFEAK